MSGRPPLVLLGFGDVARQVVAQAGADRDVIVTTRDTQRAARLREEGLNALHTHPEGAALKALPEGAHVVVSFPPDGHTDAQWARVLPRPARLVYISSTGVYPTHVGPLSDETPAAPDTERGARRLAAEACWQALGAVVLRAPAIYGPHRGVLQRVRAGKYRLVDGGEGRVSRIHVEDLAACVVAALERGQPGKAHVVGDLHPCSQREIVEYICQAEGLPMPSSQPRSEAPPTLGGDRAVDPRPALEALGVTLRYPTYREGLAPVLRTAGGAG